MIQLISALICGVSTLYLLLQHVLNAKMVSKPNFLEWLLKVSPAFLFWLIFVCWLVNSYSFFQEKNVGLLFFTVICFAVSTVAHVRSYVSRLW